MNVEFVGESEDFEIYCVGGSHIFQLNIGASPAEVRRQGEIFAKWAEFMEEVAAIHANGNG